MIESIRRYRFGFAVLCVAGLFAFSLGYAAMSDTDTDTVRITLGPYKLRIPEANSLQGKAPFWIAMIPGLDSGEKSTNIIFSSDEVAASIPGLAPDTELLGTLHYVTEEEYDAYRHHSLGVDLWYGRGAHKHKRFEPWEGTGLYRAFDARHDKHVFWEVVRMRPDPHRSPPDNIQDFFVANCSGNFDAGKSSCSTFVLFDRLLVEFSVKEQKLLRIEEIRQFIKEKVSSWIVSK